ncbi:MAG: hypothetical protein QGI83_01810 [Candidatus Latescibacteria bacterium]|nr:hypothetical protein [Candidatus Latescibacterota bacterium]
MEGQREDGSGVGEHQKTKRVLGDEAERQNLLSIGLCTLLVLRDHGGGVRPREHEVRLPRRGRPHGGQDDACRIISVEGAAGRTGVAWRSV